MMGRWVWICPLLALALAAALFTLWGWSLWTALLAALLLACPAILIWGMIELRRLPEYPLVAPPQTHGMTMDWAVPVYDWYCPKLGLGTRFRQETLRHAALATGSRVLDVGCGTGVLTRLAAEAVGATGQVVGIDPGPAMLAAARHNAAALGARVEFKLAAIEALPFADASFDAVLSSFMLHHLPLPTKLAGLREVQRVLKPGGRLLVADIGRPLNPLWWLAIWPLLLMPMTASQLLGQLPGYLAAAGFVDIQAVGHKGGWITFWRAQKAAR